MDSRQELADDRARLRPGGAAMIAGEAKVDRDAVYQRLRRWAANHPRIVDGRRRRYLLFRELLDLQPDDSILDVAAGRGGALAVFNQTNPITALELFEGNRPHLERFPNVTFVQGDALRMPFPDDSFDVVFCNSLIEHIRPEERPLLAAEIRRVARRGYFVETPDRYFPLEPHLLIPFEQFFPRRLHEWLFAKLTSADYTRLLGPGELRRLFPDASLRRERAGGLTKSLIIWGSAPRAARR